MKRAVEYASELVLPDEIRHLLEDTQEYVMADIHEKDKTACHFSWLEHRLIEWFLNHAKEEEV
jgi:hypothetical protein